MKKGFKFFYVTAAVLLTAYICSFLTRMGPEGWYNQVTRPEFTPPAAVFGIVWSIIYVLLVVSSYLALRDADSAARNQANNLFLAQLALQILWCFAFFAEGQTGLGMLLIILLDIVVYKMIAVFLQIRKLAGWLLYPYYWWLVFATFLNAVYISALGPVVSM